MSILATTREYVAGRFERDPHNCTQLGRADTPLAGSPLAARAHARALSVLSSSTRDSGIGELG
jgi:hypothetical protein